MSELFRQVRAASALSLIAAAITAAILGTHRAEWDLLVWFGNVLLTSALRFYLYHRFARETPEARCRHAGTWLSRHRTTAFLVGTAWGLLPLYSPADAPGSYQEMTTLIPAFMVMAAATAYGTYLSHFVAFMVGIVLTFTAATLYVDGLAAAPVLALYAVFAPFLYLLASRFAHLLRDARQAYHDADVALDDVTRVNHELSASNRKLAAQRELLEREDALARHVFDQLILGSATSPRGIRTWNRAMGSLSGDLVQVVQGTTGDTYVFVGDFTGHGLPAALGAVPAASIFSTMAGKCLPVDLIASELNLKLHQLLPVGYFCCAAVVRIDADRNKLTLWNGGLPPVLVRRAGGQVEVLRGSGLPLGIVSRAEFVADTADIDLDTGDETYIYTDGLTEAEDMDGTQWGRRRLLDFLHRADVAAPRLESLKEEMLAFVGPAPQSDDVSIVAIERDPPPPMRASAA